LVVPFLPFWIFPFKTLISFRGLSQIAFFTEYAPGYLVFEDNRVGNNNRFSKHRHPISSLFLWTTGLFNLFPKGGFFQSGFNTIWVELSKLGPFFKLQN